MPQDRTNKDVSVIALLGGPKEWKQLRCPTAGDGLRSDCNKILCG
jgi:hypothetical protein